MDYSIIIPAYNSGKYIYKCLDSLIKLKYPNIEFIVIDDGSKDNTSVVVKELMENDQRIKYFYKENSGVSDARNLGIANAMGQYIIFLDSDDISLMTDEFLYKCFDLECDLVVFGYNLITRYHSIENRPLNSGIAINSVNTFLDMINSKTFNPPYNKIFKKDRIRKFFLSGIGMGEDYIFNVNYLSNCEKIFFSKEILYDYRVNDNSAISNIKNYSANAVCLAGVETYKSLVKVFPGEENVIRNISADLLEDRIMGDLQKIISFGKNSEIDGILKEWTNTIINNQNIIELLDEREISSILKMSVVDIKKILYKKYRVQIFKSRIKSFLIDFILR